ncbi:MAG: DUF2124 domain-containing protein [Methanothrix sp.]|uniref:DUF2124 domain-containing protein n=1 Tax=Methanothrix sp. TaxID=90426 RepID=UPI0032AFEAC7|nr:DUF2124 domain-containing protein [Methanothrix sp.]
MEKVQDVKGLGGMLNGFRDMVKEYESITFIGSPGFCTPFALFLGYPVREKRLAFVPGLSADRTRRVIATEYGMELGDRCSPDADVLVVLGGMAMPKIGVSIEEMKQLLSRIPHKSVMGVCFMGIFEKAGWCDRIEFDYVMNTIIEGDIAKR